MGATGGGAGFGADGLRGGSGVLAAPKLGEGRRVPGALESRVNLWTVGADETSLRGVEGRGTLNSGAGLGCTGLREAGLRGVGRLGGAGPRGTCGLGGAHLRGTRPLRGARIWATGGLGVGRLQGAGFGAGDAGGAPWRRGRDCRYRDLDGCVSGCVCYCGCCLS